MKLLYRALIIKIFELIYGKINYPKEKFTIKELKINHLNFYNRKFKLYELIQGRIFTDCNTNVAYISKGNVLTNFSYQQNKDKISSIKYNSVLKSNTPKIKKKISGKVFSLVQGASGNNYWHWLFDLLPKIEILYTNNRINYFDYYYVPRLNNYIIDTLKIYGIRQNQLINSQEFKHIETESLYFLENIYFKIGDFQSQFVNIPLNIVKSIRKRFLKYKSKKIFKKKIFIDRSDSKFTHYQFYENQKIIKKLKAKNFGIFKLTKLNIFDQISLFNSSKLVIGLHGAGFANVIFCKKKTKIYEIIKKNESTRDAIKVISNHSNLTHKKIIVNKFKKYDGYYQLVFDDKYFKIFK
tara:strand:+ start:3110 stop:4168 length:1059 start_codon:yes stop_codon:yes gene_type:complete